MSTRSARIKQAQRQYLQGVWVAREGLTLPTVPPSPPRSTDSHTITLTIHPHCFTNNIYHFLYMNLTTSTSIQVLTLLLHPSRTWHYFCIYPGPDTLPLYLSRTWPYFCIYPGPDTLPLYLSRTWPYFCIYPGPDTLRLYLSRPWHYLYIQPKCNTTTHGLNSLT